MTIVVYKDGVLASDSNITNGGIIVGTGKKVLKTPDGYLLGGAGSYATLCMFFDWFQDENENKAPIQSLKLEDFEGIIITPDGDVAVIDPTGFPMEMEAPYHTFGSGSAFAHGALAHGASAIEAVKYAIKWVPSCGGKAVSVKL